MLLVERDTICCNLLQAAGIPSAISLVLHHSAQRKHLRLQLDFSAPELAGLLQRLALTLLQRIASR